MNSLKTYNVCNHSQVDRNASKSKLDWMLGIVKNICMNLWNFILFYVLSSQHPIYSVFGTYLAFYYHSVSNTDCYILHKLRSGQLVSPCSFCPVIGHWLSGYVVISTNCLPLNLSLFLFLIFKFSQPSCFA
jgi:hypothetical protein